MDKLHKPIRERGIEHRLNEKTTLRATGRAFKVDHVRNMSVSSLNRSQSDSMLSQLKTKITSTAASVRPPVANTNNKIYEKRKALLAAWKQKKEEEGKSKIPKPAFKVGYASSDKLQSTFNSSRINTSSLTRSQSDASGSKFLFKVSNKENYQPSSSTNTTMNRSNSHGIKFDLKFCPKTFELSNKSTTTNSLPPRVQHTNKVLCKQSAAHVSSAKTVTSSNKSSYTQATSSTSMSVKIAELAKKVASVKVNDVKKSSSGENTAKKLVSNVNDTSMNTNFLHSSPLKGGKFEFKMDANEFLFNSVVSPCKSLQPVFNENQVLAEDRNVVCKLDKISRKKWEKPKFLHVEFRDVPSIPETNDNIKCESGVNIEEETQESFDKCEQINLMPSEVSNDAVHLVESSQVDKKIITNDFDLCAHSSLDTNVITFDSMCESKCSEMKEIAIRNEQIDVLQLKNIKNDQNTVAIEQDMRLKVDKLEKKFKNVNFGSPEIKEYDVVPLQREDVFIEDEASTREVKQVTRERASSDQYTSPKIRAGRLSIGRRLSKRLSSILLPINIDEAEIDCELTDKQREELKYYRQLVTDETNNLTKLSEKWNEFVKEAPEDNQGDIRSAVGLAQLLIDERFAQFIELIDQCEFKTGEKPIKTSDLQGFWEMVNYQVDDVKRKFVSLQKLKENNYVEEIVVPIRKANIKVVKPKVPSNASVAPKSNKSSTTKSKFLEFRQQMIKKKVGEPQSFIDVLIPQIKLEESNQEISNVLMNVIKENSVEPIDETKKISNLILDSNPWANVDPKAYELYKAITHDHKLLLPGFSDNNLHATSSTTPCTPRTPSNRRLNTTTAHSDIIQSPLWKLTIVSSHGKRLSRSGKK